MARRSLLLIFTLTVFVLIHRQKFTQDQTVHYPAPSASNVNAPVTDPNNYYRTGKYDMSLAPLPKWNVNNPLGFLDIMSRKKINGYMFSQYNLYKLEINFIDLGYSSMVQLNYWAQDIGSIKIQQKVGFSLSEDMNEPTLNYHFEKQKFKMTVRQSLRIGRDNQTQTVTIFNVSVVQNKIQLEANYTHIRRDEQCMTAVRNKIISHKCYGGYGYGKVKASQIYYDQQMDQYRTKLSAYNPKTNQTRCSFDGFRGSGWTWKWTWMYGAGFSKPLFYALNHTIPKESWIGFNFGSLYNRSEDFLFLDGKIYPIQGIKYKIDERFSIGPENNITFTATNPVINMSFQPMHRNWFYDDMGIFKNDMVKCEGHWAGYLMNPQNTTQKIAFYQMSGLMQTVNSIF